MPGPLRAHQQDPDRHLPRPRPLRVQRGARAAHRPGRPGDRDRAGRATHAEPHSARADALRPGNHDSRGGGLLRQRRLPGRPRGSGRSAQRIPGARARGVRKRRSRRRTRAGHPEGEPDAGAVPRALSRDGEEPGPRSRTPGPPRAGSSRGGVSSARKRGSAPRSTRGAARAANRPTGSRADTESRSGIAAGWASPASSRRRGPAPSKAPARSSTGAGRSSSRPARATSVRGSRPVSRKIAGEALGIDHARGHGATRRYRPHPVRGRELREPGHGDGRQRGARGGERASRPGARAGRGPARDAGRRPRHRSGGAVRARTGGAARSPGSRTSPASRRCTTSVASRWPIPTG